MKAYRLILLTSLLAAQICQAGTVIRRLMPFTSDDNVKLDILLSENAPRQGFSARIVPCEGEGVLWEGSLDGAGAFTSDTTYTVRIGNLRPRLWSTAEPVLYNVEVSLGAQTETVRVGFRRFEMKDGNFFLNGRKVFLRGNAINPPNRGIPKELEASKAFARDYVRFLKGMNINIIRIPDNQNWMDVCDEEGMMIFGGRYGRPTGGTTQGPPEDFEKSLSIYKNTDLGDFASHPSVVIYTLSNEMGTRGKTGEAYMDFLRRVHKELKTNWDDTREYIGNAGYGLGRAGDIYDVHRYWGWYYNSFLTFLNLRDVQMWQNPGKTQAITFTECVGNYTGIDGRFNLCSRTKQPGSQKCWTGHLAPSQQADAALEYQAYVLKNVTEMFRRLRPYNPYISGLMPFTIIFFDWDEVHSFAQMRPKPAAWQYGVSYQPVLLSWECWSPNVTAGSKIPVTAHVINDDDLGRDLQPCSLEWRIEDADRRQIAAGTVKVPAVDYYGTWRSKLEIPVPKDAVSGEYRLHGALIADDGSVVSHNSFDFFIASPLWKGRASAERPVKVFDPSGKTARALSALGIKAAKLSSFNGLKPREVLVIGEDAADALGAADKEALEKYMQDGGRVLCLRQGTSFDPSWIDPGIKTLDFSNNDPTYLSPSYEYMDGMNINIERPEHPVFEGLCRDRVKLWSDYTGFDESKEGFPMIYPVRGGFLAHDVDLSNAVLLANYTRNLSACALIEVRHGKGSVLYSGFDLAARTGVDPVAEKLLTNLVNYAASTRAVEPYTEVGSTIVWGDYESERGIVTGAVNGLVVNPYPIVPLNKRARYPLKVDARGYHYVGSYGGWNSRPGIQYLPRGRRPFAPFSFSLGGNDLVDDEKGTSTAEGYFVAKAPAGTTTMTTIFENNAGEAIKVSIDVNGGRKKTLTIPANGQASTDSALPADGRIKVHIEGDRRTVLLRTEFK